MTKQRDAVLISGIAALALAMGIGRFSYTLLLPAMAQVAGFTAGAAANVAAWNYAGYLLGAVLSRHAALRANSLFVLRASLVASTLTSALMAATTNQAWWSVIRCASGVASGFVFVYASAVVLDRAQRLQRSNWPGILYSGIGIGIVASAILVGTANVDSFRTLWMLMAALSALLFCLAVAGLRDAPVSDSSPVLARATPQNTGLLRLIYAAFFAESIGYVIPATFVVYFVNGDPALHAYRVLIWAIVGVFAAPSAIVWQRLARGRPPFVFAGIAMLVQAAGVAVDLLVPSLLGAIVLAATLGFTFVAITSLIVRAACDISPLTTDATVAQLTIAFGTGQIIGPLLAAVTLHRVPGTNGALITALASLALGTALLWLVPLFSTKVRCYT